MGTSSEIYAKFVMKIVAQEDPTRIVWPSCPSRNGWKTGVYTLTGIPNGLPLSTPNTTNDFPIEIHGPYMHGSSPFFQSVNGHYTKL